MVQEGVIPVVWVDPLLLGSRTLFLFGGRLLSDRRDNRQKDLNLDRGLYRSDEITALRALRIALTKRCLISTPSRMDSKERDLVLIFFAMAAGDDRGMR
jgi:hypothetical protein